MTKTRWIILAAIVSGVVLAGIYLNKWLFGAACFIGGAVVHNNWKGIVGLVRPVKKQKTP